MLIIVIPRPGGLVKFQSGCRMLDSAASFFLKAIPCRLPKLLSWPLPFSKECGSGRRCRLWAERDAMFFHDDVNFPDGRRQVSGVGTTAAPCRPLKAAAHASSGTACRSPYPRADRPGPGQQIRKGQAGKRLFSLILHVLPEFSETYGPGKNAARPGLHLMSEKIRLRFLSSPG